MLQRDQEIIELTDRYRIGTNAAYANYIFRYQSTNAVAKVTARLCRQGWLQRYPLIPPEDYFTLGPTAVQQLGYSARRTEPLGPQSLPIEFAVLLYAMHGDRCRMTSAEIKEQMPWMTSNLCHGPYCRTSRGIIELVRVDLGGSPHHVAKKAAIDCSKRLELAEFRQLVECDRFQLVVLTTSFSKSRLIRQAIESMNWTTSVRLHLAMIPLLTQLHLRQA